MPRSPFPRRVGSLLGPLAAALLSALVLTALVLTALVLPVPAHAAVGEPGPTARPTLAGAGTPPHLLATAVLAATLVALGSLALARSRRR